MVTGYYTILYNKKIIIYYKNKKTVPFYIIKRLPDQSDEQISCYL